MGKKIQYIGRYNMDGVLLGKGNFARVELAQHQVTEIKVAVKVIDTKKIKEDYIRQNLHREAKIMSQLRHPNIIRLYETLKATTLYCLVLEYAAGGELLAYIKQQDKSRLSENDARPFVRQLVSALHYLHDKNVVHRDLKMENIMLDEKKKSIKLIDFGLSNLYKPDDPLRTHCGSPEYAAPELFVVGKTYGPEIDVWSLGIIMYAIVLGKLPFFTPYKDEYQRQRMLQQIQKGLSQYNEREMMALSSEARNLLHQILEPNPEARIPLSEIEIHPWLTKNGKYVFTPYVPLPKDKQLRHVCTSELAIMTGIKRMMVEEQVKEHKADELSAMFNMLMYKKQRERGLFDGDHTCKRVKRESRSKSRERDARLRTPDSTKGKELRGGGRTPGKKGAAKARLNAVTRPNSLDTSVERKASETQMKRLTVNNLTVSCDEHDYTAAVDAHSSNRQTAGQHPPSTPLTAARPLHASLLKSHHHPSAAQHSHSVHKSTNNPSMHNSARGGPLTANGPVTRIPLSQRRMPPPPAKLNMTLDLSVTTPRTSSARAVQAWRAKHATVAGCTGDGAADGETASQTGSCAGVAASSGVRPRIASSPRDSKSSKSSVMSPKSKDGARTPLSPPIVSDKRAPRPSTLRYLMTGLEKVRKRLPSTESSQKASSICDSTGIEIKGDQTDLEESETDADWMKAPKATPEDSVIDSYSSPSPEETGQVLPKAACVRKVVAQVEANAPSQKNQLNPQKGARQSVTFQTDTVCANNKHSEHTEEKARIDQHKTGILKHFKSKHVSCEQAKDALPSSDGEVLEKCPVISDVQCEELLKVKRLSFEIQDEPPSYESLTSQLTKSSQTSMTSCPLQHVDHNLTDSGSGFLSSCEPLLQTQPSNLTTLPTSGSEPLAVGSLRLAELKDEPLTLSFSNPSKLDNTHLGCQACGLSPGSPSYDVRHSKFCHTGAHALDMFFSPDEVPSPVGTFWKPTAYSQISRDSPTRESPTHRQTAATGCYRLPRVGADTPRIPMQMPIATAEVLSQSCPLGLPHVGDSDDLYALPQSTAAAAKHGSPHLPQSDHRSTSNSTHSPHSKASPLYPTPQTSPCGMPKPGSHSPTALCSIGDKKQRREGGAFTNNVTDGFREGAVFTPVPDTSLRLEPVGGSSESLAVMDAGEESQRVQGDGCTDKTSSGQCTVAPPPGGGTVTTPPQEDVPALQSSISDVSLHCQQKEIPSVPALNPASKCPPSPGHNGSRKGDHCPVTASWGSKTARVLHLLHGRHHGVIGHMPSGGIQGNSIGSNSCNHKTAPNSLPSTPERKRSRNRLLWQWDGRSAHGRWRQGISHLLRLRRSSSIPANNNHTSSNHNCQSSGKMGNNTHAVSKAMPDAHTTVATIDRNGDPMRNLRCNSIDEAYYRHLDALWTAPAHPGPLSKTASLELETGPAPMQKTAVIPATYDVSTSVIPDPEMPSQGPPRCQHCVTIDHLGSRRSSHSFKRRGSSSTGTTSSSASPPPPKSRSTPNSIPPHGGAAPVAHSGAHRASVLPSS